MTSSLEQITRPSLSDAVVTRTRQRVKRLETKDRQRLPEARVIPGAMRPEDVAKAFRTEVIALKEIQDPVILKETLRAIEEQYAAKFSESEEQTEKWQEIAEKTLDDLFFLLRKEPEKLEVIQPSPLSEEERQLFEKNGLSDAEMYHIRLGRQAAQPFTLEELQSGAVRACGLVLSEQFDAPSDHRKLVEQAIETFVKRQEWFDIRGSALIKELAKRFMPNFAYFVHETRLGKALKGLFWTSRVLSSLHLQSGWLATDGQQPPVNQDDEREMIRSLLRAHVQAPQQESLATAPVESVATHRPEEASRREYHLEGAPISPEQMEAFLQSLPASISRHIDRVSYEPRPTGTGANRDEAGLQARYQVDQNQRMSLVMYPSFFRGDHGVVDARAAVRLVLTHEASHAGIGINETRGRFTPEARQARDAFMQWMLHQYASDVRDQVRAEERIQDHPYDQPMTSYIHRHLHERSPDETVFREASADIAGALAGIGPKPSEFRGTWEQYAAQQMASEFHTTPAVMERYIQAVEAYYRVTDPQYSFERMASLREQAMDGMEAGTNRRIAEELFSQHLYTPLARRVSEHLLRQLREGGYPRDEQWEQTRRQALRAILGHTEWRRNTTITTPREGDFSVNINQQLQDYIVTIHRAEEILYSVSTDQMQQEQTVESSELQELVSRLRLRERVFQNLPEQDQRAIEEIMTSVCP